MEKLFRINNSDNVAVALETGHKSALCDIKKGDNIIKYGFPIGHATADIKKGDLVHTDNLKTNLDGLLEYSYMPSYDVIKVGNTDKTFMGYVRENGDVGIRNDIWIVNTVGCVNKVAQKLSEKTGAKHFPHPFGCSQLGDDHTMTQAVLKGLVNHPNAGGVLVLGLGCENNNIDTFKAYLGDINEKRVKFLNTSECEDDIREGIKLIEELKSYAGTFKREPVNISKLKIGLKCGGSDGFSGITANPLVGRVSDKLISMGGTSVLTEVPEMFGAEHILRERCETKEIFDKTVSLINNFKEYFMNHNQPVYENPSPGNKAGGITTLEEKSLGCTQKGGKGIVTNVIDINLPKTKSGLNLLNGPGNDMVAVTNLTVAGVHLILFTTGRGTPLGAPVPTVKIASNKNLFQRKNNWIDFDASEILNKDISDELFSLCIDVAEGKQTKNEINGYEEISIFKDGITL